MLDYRFDSRFMQALNAVIINKEKKLRRSCLKGLDLTFSSPRAQTYSI